MRISTKGRGIIKAQQGTVARPTVGGGIADAIDLLNGSLSGSTLIFFNNTTTDTTMGISIMSMYGQSTSATPDIPASSMVVYPIAGVVRNVVLFGNSVIGSNIYVAFLLNNVKNIKYYSNYETDRLIIGTNQNLPVQGMLVVMCINNTNKIATEQYLVNLAGGGTNTPTKCATRDRVEFFGLETNDNYANNQLVKEEDIQLSTF